ncbi:hypothetical protein APUTEX25_002286, partial [Auxenochlorella protothecoides]
AGDVAPLTYVVFQIEDQLVVRGVAHEVACDLEGRALEARDARLARGLQRRERTIGTSRPSARQPAPHGCLVGRRTRSNVRAGDRMTAPRRRWTVAADASVREAVLKSAACTSLQPHRQPPSPARLRRMMHATDKEREAHESSEEEPERVSKSSIRKLVADMHARGWHPVRQGHSGHYKYERLIPELGGLRQMHMLAGTPSSRRYIWAVRAAMARADREVAELRARQQGPSLVA